MAGIYIHIPFCKQACSYCDFHFSTTVKNQNKMVDALCKEIELRHNYIGNDILKTIYFGGGTPSLLSIEQIEKILSKIYATFSVASSIEITLEANPDDLTNHKLQELKNTEINRLSIGIQSFFDRDLLFMHRSHTAAEAKQCVENAQHIGFDNITIDLIYGVPNLTNKEWETNLQTAIALNVPHISSYCLTVEPKTALAHMVAKKQVFQVVDEVTESQFNYLIKTLGNHGFEQYEISNFAKKGYISQHNSNYWKGETYIGIGPSSHSFDGSSRQWNVANNNRYLTALQENNTCFEKEILTKEQKYNEYILTSLRTKWGVGTHYILNNFGKEITGFFKKEAKKQQKMGFLTQKNGIYFLTPAGKFLADRISSDLFYV